MLSANEILEGQRRIYSGSFYNVNRWRWFFRDDCRYRRRRLKAVFKEIDFDPNGKRIFDVGFGTGDLLLSFPETCSLYGAELSAEAVEAIKNEPGIKKYPYSSFEVIPHSGETPLPANKVDVVITSHVLEHVPDENAFLDRLCEALVPGGIMINFVPIESEGFDPKHIRTYTAESLALAMSFAGLEIIHAESNYHICSGPLKWLDHPARHNWAHGSWLEGVRHFMLSPVPFELTRGIEKMLAALGVSPSQAMVIGRKKK